MIRLERAEAAPDYLQSAEVERLRTEVRTFFDRPERQRRQQRPEFGLFPKALFARLMADVLGLSHEKCAYCETPLKLGANASLDRYRPKAGAVGLDGDYSMSHYWWLAYSWQNLYPSCLKCNKFKGAKFPVEGERARAGAALDEVRSERRLLLDPFNDDPLKHLDFLEDGTATPLSTQGEVTIATFELNRSELITERARVGMEFTSQLKELKFGTMVLEEGIDMLRRLLKAGRAEGASPTSLSRLARFADPKSPWSAAAWAALRRRDSAKGLPDRARSSATKAETSAKTTPYGSTAKQKAVSTKAQALRTRVVTRVSIHNFRGIRDLDIGIDFERGKGAPWTVLLGENGTGKSSILQAVALTLADSVTLPRASSPQQVLRKGQREGWVRVWLDEATEPKAIEFRKHSQHFRRSGPRFPTVLLGYGATRLLPYGRVKDKHGRVKDKRGRVRLGNMFDPFRPLIDADTWLGQLELKSFDYVAGALKEVLGLPRSARLRRARTQGVPGVKLRLYGADLTLHDLSDGYQSVMGLTCDIIAGLHATAKGGLEAAEGLVAIDELGSHLHPRWRMRMVESLRKAFPRVQFIASTHDPLCLRGLENGEALVLRRTSRGRVFLVPELPPIKGLRVDQLLTSEYFGLNSTMDPTIEQKYRELYRLLAMREPSGKQKERLAELRVELKPYDLPGATRRERRMLEIIDKELALSDEQPSPAKRRQIRDESDRMIADLNEKISLARGTS